MAAGIIALVGIDWNVFKVLQRCEEEWIQTKGILVEYKVEINQNNGPDDFPDVLKEESDEQYFGYYEFEDHKGESRIHKSEQGYSKKCSTVHAGRERFT